MSHRRAQSDCLQNRLPITQHFGKVRTNLCVLCLSGCPPMFFLFLSFLPGSAALLCVNCNLIPNPMCPAYLEMLLCCVTLYCCMAVTSSSAWLQTEGCWGHAGCDRHQRSLESVSKNTPSGPESVGMFSNSHLSCFNVSQELHPGLQ